MEKLLAATTTADVGAQTGGVKASGRTAGIPKGEKRLDVATLVSRMRVSYPIIKASALDNGLRQMLFSEMASQSLRDGTSVVLPKGLRVQILETEQFALYKDKLSGVTEDTLPSIKKALVKIGLTGTSETLGGEVSDESIMDVDR